MLLEIEELRKSARAARSKRERSSGVECLQRRSLTVLEFFRGRSGLGRSRRRVPGVVVINRAKSLAQSAVTGRSERERGNDHASRYFHDRRRRLDGIFQGRELGFEA